jgi:hypothetical protein
MARARSFGNIRKLPSGRYQARYWNLGKQIPADTTFANKTEALARDDRGRHGPRRVDRPDRRRAPVRRVRDSVGRGAPGAPADA